MGTGVAGITVVSAEVESSSGAAHCGQNRAPGVDSCEQVGQRNIWLS